MNTGVGATGTFGCSGFALIVGVCTILQLSVSTFTTGSTSKEAGYKCVPDN